MKSPIERGIYYLLALIALLCSLMLYHEHHYGYALLALFVAAIALGEGAT
jgi:NADH:ubiquinone oxidoreductase subunit 6 (subunit J)